jgi:hypothetical protein
LARQDRHDARGLRIELDRLCNTLTEAGELDEALLIAREAASIASDLGLLWRFLNEIASLALKRGHATEAALVFGRACAMDTWRDVEPPPADKRSRTGFLRQLRMVLDGPELDQLLAKGAALSDDDAARIGLAQ